MKRVKIAVGQRVGRLVVLHQDAAKPRGATKHLHWTCLCDCGSKKSIRGSRLVAGLTRSCGCLIVEILSKSTKTHGHSRTGNPSYYAWLALRARCSNKKHASYPDYGGRGITVCERWRKFENFYIDMGPRPSRLHSIDRIDNDGPYAPTNCRWATHVEQNDNRRSTVFFELNGVRLSAREWAVRLGIRRRSLIMRRDMGWSDEKALTTPIQHHGAK